MSCLYLREAVRRLHDRHMRVLPIGDLDVPARVDEARRRRQAAVDDFDAVQVLQPGGDVRRQREFEVVVQFVVKVLEINNSLHHLYYLNMERGGIVLVR